MVLYYRTYYMTDAVDKKFFILGFFLKLFGATMAVLIYTLYYNGGDTTEYFRAAENLLDFLSNNIDKSWDILWAESLRDYKDSAYLVYPQKVFYWNAKNTFFITKIVLFFNIITLNSFYLTSILCSYFSFLASWYFYKFINSFCILNRSHVGYAIFFMPSVVFWGSGLFKDTFTLAGLYLFIIGIINVFGFSKYSIKNVIFILIGIYLLYNIRSFFLLAIAPSTIIWVANLKFVNIKSWSIKLLVTPFILVFIIVSLVLLFQVVTTSIQELSIENLIDRSKGFQGWHTTLQGSSYSLGVMDYSAANILSKLPLAINVTFFRPYIWEANKPIIILSAIQSLFFLIFTIYYILKMKIIYIFVSIFRSPPALAFLIFSLFYGFVVGFTSYNFGALDRYKIPCLSTYILAILFVYESYKSNLCKN